MLITLKTNITANIGILNDEKLTNELLKIFYRENIFFWIRWKKRLLHQEKLFDNNLNTFSFGKNNAENKYKPPIKKDSARSE